MYGISQLEDRDWTFKGSVTIQGSFTFGDAATDSLAITGLFTQTYSGTADGHLVTGSGNLTAGKDLARFSTTGDISSTSNVVAIEQATGAGTAGAYGLYINCTGTNVEALKVDAGLAVFDESVTSSGGFIMDGAVTTGISVTGATTTAISVSANATTGIALITGAFTTGINIAGATALGTGVSVGLTGVTTTTAFVAGVTGSTTTTGFKTAGTVTTGIDLGGTLTTGIVIGACTTGINITGNTTNAIVVGGTQTSVLVVNGAGTNLLEFDAVEGALSTATGTATISHKIACKVTGGATFYLVGASGIA